MKNLFKTQNMLLAFVCLALNSTVLTAQSILTVDNNPGNTALYNTLQDAHDAATSGDIIYVQPSTSNYGNVNITKPITIIGRSHSEPGNRSIIDDVSVRSSDVTLKGLRIDNISTSTSSTPNTPPFEGLTISECSLDSFSLGNSTSSASAIDIKDVNIRGNVINSSINVRADTEDILIANNIIRSTSIQTHNTTSFIITNNIFKFSSSVNFFNYTPLVFIVYNNMFILNSNSSSSSVGKIRLSSGEFNLNNNLTYNYGTGNQPFFETSSGGSFLENNTINADPLFTDVNPNDSDSFAGTSSYNPGARLADDLTLQPGSPALTGGGGGTELGLYSNGFIYDMIGNPKGFPLLDILNYDGAVPKNGNINVTIKAVAK